MRDFHYASIHELSKLIKTQKVSPVEVVEACLKQIEELNPKLNAFITILANEARKESQIAEEEIKKGKYKGPLHGIPVGIKDFYDTAGVKTTAGFKYFKNRIPQKDAVGVAKLKAAGAIIIGKMNMHSLGTGTTGLDSAFGPAQNPWDNNYIPGGSSSGSAVAVAAGMCFATLDTDAVGSCRLPASCCGVTGFKGTYNLITAEGILAGERPPEEMILWLSHPAITTRNAKDTALMLDILADKNDQLKSIVFSEELTKKKKLKIGIANNFRADKEVEEAFNNAVSKIKTFGYEIKDIAVPFGDPMGGIKNIKEDRKNIAEQLFKDVDVVLLPTLPTIVPTVREVGKNPQGLSPENTAFANYYGIPAISVPCGLDQNGLPIGLQIVAKPWDEDSILQLADEYQEATKPFLRPTLKIHKKELNFFQKLLNSK